MRRRTPRRRAEGDAALVRRAALRLGLQAAAGTLVVLVLMITVLGVLQVRNADGKMVPLGSILDAHGMHAIKPYAFASAAIRSR